MANKTTMDDNINKTHYVPSYLPPPPPQLSSIATPPQPQQSKRRRLNLPSPHQLKSNNNNTKTSPLPPPITPSKMDMKAMDIRIRQKRINSLDALIKDQITDNNNNNNNIRIITSPSSIHSISVENDKLIALINCKSGARNGYLLAKQLEKYSATIYDLLDLNNNILIRRKLSSELQLYNNKCIVLICGGDGSTAWASSLIDKSLSLNNNKLPFPSIAIFPMGTGNDLSRSLGWGSLEPNRKQLIDYISDIHFCAKLAKRWSDLDRWRVIYTFPHINDNDIKIDNDIDDIDDDLNDNDMNQILNDIDVNSPNKFNVNQKDFNYTQQLHELFQRHPSNGFKQRSADYIIPPPQQYLIQNDSNSNTYKYIHSTFNPPLPSTFLCYLSIGYDALVAWKFEQDRRLNPDKFNNQFKNQIMYVKHGFSEFFNPSTPINDSIEVIISNKIIKIPDNTRSLKLININSAANGLFFWGNGKSKDGELQNTVPPKLNDGLIEVMATRGVHDMLTYRVNISHAQRLSQTNDVIINVKKPGIALQIDGEAFIVNTKCKLQIQIHDKLPVVIGYNEPRGVESWLKASLNDLNILKAKQAFRKRMYNKYHRKSKNNNKNEEKTLMSILGLNDLFQNDNSNSTSVSTISSPSKSKSDKSFINSLEEIFKYKYKFSNSINDNDNDNQTDELKSEELMNDKNTPTTSPISKKKKDGMILDRFTWWKVTRARNSNQSIDMDVVIDAASNHSNKKKKDRKTQSSSNIKTQKSTFSSLF